MKNELAKSYESSRIYSNLIQEEHNNIAIFDKRIKKYNKIISDTFVKLFL